MHNEDAFERLGRFYTDSATWGEAPRVRAMAVRVGASFGRELGFEIGALILGRPAMNPMDVTLPYRVVHSWGFEAFQGQTSPGALAAAIERFRDKLAEGHCMCSERFLPWDRVPETVRPELGRMGITAVGSWMFRTNGLDGVILLGRSHDREEDDRVVSLAVLQVGTVATLLAARRVAESYARTDALTGLWNPFSSIRPRAIQDDSAVGRPRA